MEVDVEQAGEDRGWLGRATRPWRSNSDTDGPCGDASPPRRNSVVQAGAVVRLNLRGGEREARNADRCPKPLRRPTFYRLP